MVSVTTNSPALVAPLRLRSTQDDLSGIQARLNADLKVASAHDTDAALVIARVQRARRYSRAHFTDATDRATGAIVRSPSR